MVFIHARDIVVDFPIYGVTNRSLKNVFIHAATGGVIAKDSAQRIIVRALDHISFEINQGDRVGLIGHNGSGKSTLLRVLSGAYEPASGELVVRGNVVSMLNIWLGMDMGATGYENIYLRGTIMGLGRRQIEGMVSNICEFADIGGYLEMPLRTYSSGMAMRLAFAVSTCVQSDIILMDEWMGVGDSNFMDKAQNRLTTLVGNAKILVLASHDLALIRKNCNRIIHLDHGKIVLCEENHTAVSVAV